ncbi:MAG: hypothetical protein CR972_03905 [Candidatus Moraniibacteriota bacterium]|nr:MAG: hypothetical protein CR972_03905 [Candidatus Moranbacteria bacterium]
MPFFKIFLDTTFKKMLFISIVYLITMIVIFFFYIIPRINEILMEERKQIVREMTNFMVEVFEELETQEQTKYLPDGQAEEIAKDIINGYLYQNNDYFFAIDAKNKKIIATPFKNQLNKTMIDEIDTIGHPFGKDALKDTRSNAENLFISYKWNKTESDKIGQKLSYFAQFEPWQWLIGTGVYIDDITQEINAIIRKIVSVFSSILFLIISLLIYILRTSAKIEKQKNEIELQFMSLIKNLPIAVFRIELAKDNKGSSLILWNKSLINTCEFPYEDYPSKHGFRLQNLLVNQEDRIDIIKRAKDGTLLGKEYEIRTFTGKHLWIRIFGYITKKNFKTFLDASIENVTRNYEADKLLKKSYDELWKIGEIKNEIISITSYELKTPLANINDIISYFSKENTKNFNKQQKNYLQKIKKNTNKLLEMINNMMDLEKLEKGEMNLNITKVEMNEVLKDVHEDFQARCILEKKKCIINLTHPKIYINADKAQLKRVFTNLLDNAFKFTKNKTGVIEIFTEVTSNTVKIHIKDNGIGISKEDKEKVFKKFTQVENNIERKMNGSGLGLPIVKTIVEQLNGKIEFESQSKKGSDFYITFPLIKNI